MKKSVALLIAFLFTACVSQTSNDVREPSATQTVVDSGYEFNPTDTSCGGFPRLKVQTMPGTCLGMVFSARNTLGADGKSLFKMPRTIVPVPGTDDFLVADMGGWGSNLGKLFWLHRSADSGQYKLVKIKDKLDYAHGLAFNDGDQFFYLGEKNRIVRFRFDQGKMLQVQTVIDNMPDTAKHMHPLTHFVFDPATHDLYINSGAPTDACYQENGNYTQRCPEESLQKMATIQKISAEKLKSLPSGGLHIGDVEVVAEGLRNSMAMAIHPVGRFLIQGENSRDFPELEEPYEELNVIRLDQPGVVKHYGWPYCYNNHGTSPEWEKILIKDKTEYEIYNKSPNQSVHGPNPFYCGRSAIKGLRDYQRPFSLIPPHAAPLFAGYYEGEMFKDMLGGHLLMSWHGYRPTGQRFVAYKANQQGLPVLRKGNQEHYGFNMADGCPRPTAFNPRGGSRGHFAPYTEVISGWAPIKNVRPRGAPTGFAVARDGAIWIVEDKNKTIVRLARSDTANYQQKCSTTPAVNNDANVPLLVWRNAIMNDSPQKNLRADFNFIAKGLSQDKFCVKCHDKLRSKNLNEAFAEHPDEFATLDYFVSNGWLVPGDSDKSLLYGALTGSPLAPPMPPAGYTSLITDAEGKEILARIKKWIGALPTDIESRMKQITIDKTFNIRRTPGTEFAACGQFQAGDIAYIDPRSAAKVKNGNFSWSKLYLVPGHSKLSPGACPYPLDGVFWIAK